MQHFDINQLDVAKPCGVGWDSMTGDEQKRRCDLCELDVYNVEEMTEREVNRLLFETKGRACGRIKRRSDGTVITKQCPKGLRDYGKRMARIAGAALSAVFALFSVSYGQSTSAGPDEKQSVIVRWAAKSTGISGVVEDQTGAKIPDARITISELGSKTETKKTANPDGEFLYTNLSPGVYAVKVSADGFKAKVVRSLVIQEKEIAYISFRLDTDPDEIMGDVKEVPAANLTGFVGDENGGAIPQAKVSFLGDSIPDLTSETKENGNFAAYLLKGTYTIKVEAEGFETVTIEDYVMPLDGLAILPIKMEVRKVLLKGPQVIDKPKVSGMVTDSAGAFIPGATVSLLNRSTRKQKTVRTNENGNFLFEEISDGTYEVRISYPGFKTKRIKKLKVRDGKSKKLDVSLKPKGITVVVGIFDDGPFIDLGKTDISTTVYSKSDNE